MTSAQLIPALVIPLVAWRVYARIRRSIGRQPLQPRRTLARVVIFSVITVLAGVAMLKYPPSLEGLGAGIALGLPLAWIGLRLTRFEDTAEGTFYTPNAIIGVVVTLLLVGRICYRLVVLLGQPAGAMRPPVPMFQSPATALMFGLTVGYYIAYYAGLLARARGTTERER